MGRIEFSNALHFAASAGLAVTRQHYDESVFGSWFIEISKSGRHLRIIWDGKDRRFALQRQAPGAVWENCWCGSAAAGLGDVFRQLQTC